MKHYPLGEYSNYPSIVLANGAFPQHAEPLSPIQRWLAGEEGLRLSCCDGAINKLFAYNTSKLPDLVVGDLDSVAPELKARLGERLIRVAEQESNDLTKTIRYLSAKLGERRLLLLGATGEREDHTLGNLALLPSYAPLVDELVLVTDTGHFRLIQESCTLEVKVGQQISFFDFLGTKISVSGVHWPIKDYQLPQLWCGTLNRADESIISIETSAPLLVFITHD